MLSRFLANLKALSLFYAVILSEAESKDPAKLRWFCHGI
jgi:hypothetical protein